MVSGQNSDLSPLARLLHDSVGSSAQPVAAAAPAASGSASAAPGSPRSSSDSTERSPAGVRAEVPAEQDGPRASPARRSLSFQPGLEGLRGLAVAGVLVFHGGFTWAVGGFLGVSTFFTLSGFLITSLLLLEHDSTGTIALKKFWSRRFRRLMPASLVCLAGVVVLFAPFVATPSQLDSMPGDVISALAYVANWHFVVTGQSYEQLFAAPSPLLHFWSLAIEEQFYVVFPLVVAVLVSRWSFRRTTLACVFGGLAVASAVEMAVLYDPADTSRVYYGTDTRAAELLLGAVLAIVLVDRTLLPRTVRTIAVTLGGAGLAVVLWLWHSTEQTDSWLYRGGFGLYALLSCSVIVAATQPGVVRTALANPVLRWLGRISYAAYLFHWPIFLWIDKARPDLDDYVSFVVKVAITLALAEVSLRLIEKPIREKRRITGWQPLVAAPLAVALIIGTTIFVTSQPRDLSQQVTLDQPSASLSAEAAPTTTTTLLRQPTPIDPPEPWATPPLQPFARGQDLHVMLEGDSAIFTLGGFDRYGLAGWGDATGLMRVSNVADLGCGIARGGTQQYAQKIEPAGTLCPDWEEDYVRELDGIDADTGRQIPGHVAPHVVVGMFGIWDVLNKELANDDRWRHIGDPLYDAFFARELAKAMDTLTSRGAVLIWLTHPPIASGITEGLNPADQPENDPDRMDRLNEIVGEVAATRPHVRVIDLAERQDGIHWNDQSNTVLAAWLGPQIIQTYEQAWNEIAAAQWAAAASTSTAAPSPPPGN